MSDCFVGKIGGTPFLDDSFESSTLASLVCSVRQQRLSKDGYSFKDFFNPEVARLCYDPSNGYPAVEELPSEALGEPDKSAILATIGGIVAVFPQWNNLLQIPISWQLLRNDQVSSSNVMIPQHIFVGRRAFSCSQPLAEIIVHEFSHIWLALIEEVVAIAEKSKPTLILPSGTGNKDVRQVLIAVAFSAAAVRYYQGVSRQRPLTEQESARLHILIPYTERCLEMVWESEMLTENGAAIASSCQRSLLRRRDGIYE